MNHLKLCGRCYEEVHHLIEANCDYDTSKINLGMHHCPDCGAMVMGGEKHPPLCTLCIARKHPFFEAI